MVPDFQPHGESLGQRGVSIYMFGDSGARYIRNLQKDATQEISTALHRTEKMLIGLHLATKTENSPCSQQHSRRRTTGNTINGCLKLGECNNI